MLRLGLIMTALWMALWSTAWTPVATAFDKTCEASPVQERPSQGKHGAAATVEVFLSTRCVRTGDSFFWECVEKPEGSRLLMDCHVQHADGTRGQAVRVASTTRERLGATLCRIVCEEPRQ